FPQSFLGLTHVHTDGSFDPISTAGTGLHDAVHPAAPAVAANDVGVEMIVIEQLEDTSSRATAYRSGKVSNRIDAPPAPIITSARISAGVATLTWTPQSTTQRGFIVQWTAPSALSPSQVVLPAGTTTRTIPAPRAPIQVSVIAWNEGGLSQPATVNVLPP